jgi:hypothetical protein
MLPIRTTSSVPKDSLSGENKTPDCHTYAHAQYKIGNQFIEDILKNKKIKSNLDLFRKSKTRQIPCPS